MLKFRFPESSNDSLRESAAFLGDLVSAIVKTDSNNDGKTTFLEIAWSLGSLVWKYRDINLEFKNLYVSWKDSTDEEKKAVVDAFSEHFDLSNDLIEGLIEGIINGLISLTYNTSKLITAINEKP